MNDDTLTDPLFSPTLHTQNMDTPFLPFIQQLIHTCCWTKHSSAHKYTYTQTTQHSREMSVNVSLPFPPSTTHTHTHTHTHAQTSSFSSPSLSLSSVSLPAQTLDTVLYNRSSVMNCIVQHVLCLQPSSHIVLSLHLSVWLHPSCRSEGTRQGVSQSSGCYILYLESRDGETRYIKLHKRWHTCQH